MLTEKQRAEDDEIKSYMAETTQIATQTGIPHEYTMAAVQRKGIKPRRQHGTQGVVQIIVDK